MKKIKFTNLIVMLLFAQLFSNVLAIENTQSKFEKAFQNASKSNKYLFVFFKKENNDFTKNKEELFTKTMGKLNDKADFIIIDINNTAEKETIKKYKLNTAPMPFVLTLTPNEAVAKGIPMYLITEKNLSNSFLTPVEEKCIKALQNKKLVILCVQNKEKITPSKGVIDFKKDPKYNDKTEIVLLNPTDKKESKLLKIFNIKDTENVNSTILLSPKGGVLGKINGNFEKNRIVSLVTPKPSSKGCAPGSGCCGPKK